MTLVALRCKPDTYENTAATSRFRIIAASVSGFAYIAWNAAHQGLSPMNPFLKDIRHDPLLWLLVFVPAVVAAAHLWPAAHTLLFVLSVLAILPLAALLSHATESVAAKTGDAAGGLLNATLGNLTELVIALTALRAGEFMLVKASIVGAIVTNVLFVLGASFLRA